jgi:hypothetical protein
MSDTPLEDVYDEQISPLMSQIIAICNKHKIANVASFALDEDDDGQRLLCTTCNIKDEVQPPAKFEECVEILYRRPLAVMTVETTHADGSKTIVAILPGDSP